MKKNIDLSDYKFDTKDYIVLKTTVKRDANTGSFITTKSNRSSNTKISTQKQKNS